MPSTRTPKTIDLISKLSDLSPSLAARIVPRPCGNSGWRQHRAVLNKVPFQAGPSTVYVAGGMKLELSPEFPTPGPSGPWSLPICYVDQNRD